MTPLQQKQREFILKNLKGQTDENLSIDESSKQCLYSSTNKSCGCFIGRWIKDKVDCQVMDKEAGQVDKFFSYLPWNLKELGNKFLLKIQQLHDDEYHWDNKGLTWMGFDFLDREILQKYGLDVLTQQDIDDYAKS